MKQIFEIEQEFEESTPSMGLNSSIIKHLLFSYYKDRSTHLINFAVPEIKVKEVTFFPPKKQVTVDIEGKEFEQAVRKIADEVRVKAERRNLKSKRLYTAWSYYNRVCTCNSDPCICSTFHNPDKMEFVDKENDSFIHPTAIIDEDIVIDEGTKIWHFSHICTRAHIGKNCTIGDNVYIGKKVYIGNNCKIQNNVYIPEGVEIKSDIFLGPSVTFTNIINPRATISRKDEFKSTVIRLGASIGANATILCGVTIGRYAMIGASAVVTKDVGDFQVAFGNPAKVVGTISMDGTAIHYF